MQQAATKATKAHYTHEVRYERARAKTAPNLGHGMMQFRVCGALWAYRDTYTIAAQVSLALGKWQGRPDVCVYPRLSVDWAEERPRMTKPPMIAIDIMEPTQSQQDRVSEVQAMLAAGIWSCWLVQPALRIVTVFAESQWPKTFSEGTLTDPATGIEVALRDLFLA